jgi:hypothetical protein
MTKRRKRGLSWLGGGALMALPFLAALVLVVSYLQFTLLTTGWKVAPAAAQPSRVYDLGCLPGRAGAEQDCLLKGSDLHRAKFEEAINGYWTADEWRRAVSAQGLTQWRVMTGLALVAALCALFVAGFIIGSAPHYPSTPKGFIRRVVIVVLLLALCVGVFSFVDQKGFAGGTTMSEDSTFIVRQFLGHIESQLQGGRLIEYELKLLRLGYVAALMLLCASGATLLPFGRRHPSMARLARAEVDARTKYLAMQMRHLRLLLYTGAAVLALTALRGKTNFNWALDYLPPLWALKEKSPEWLAASAFYGKLNGLALNNITGVSVLNTLLLVALYVPAAYVLQGRANRLSAVAVRLEDARAATRRAGAEVEEKAESQEAKKGPEREGERKRTKRDEWLRAHDLSFPYKEHLTRVLALLSPLLAGPVSELLSLLKG